jgi:hypothetical protein
LNSSRTAAFDQRIGEHPRRGDHCDVAGRDFMVTPRFGARPLGEPAEKGPSPERYNK